MEPLSLLQIGPLGMVKTINNLHYFNNDCNKKGRILLVFLHVFMIIEFTQFQNCGQIQGIFFFCEEEHLLVEFTYLLLSISILVYKQLVTTQPLSVIFNT
jgi:hypothetical protein